MDLFKFIPGPDPTVLEVGASINGYTSAMWTERYRDPGEFEIVAPMSSGLIQFLPLGTVISHTNTLEACVVENHNLKDDTDEDPIVSITGRSLEALLEDRIVGSNQVQSSNLVAEYIIPAGNTWYQARDLMHAHIQSATDPDDNLPNFFPYSEITTGAGVVEPRTIGRIDLLGAVQSILAVDNLGIKVVRRNPFGEAGDTNTTYFVIHKGKDVSARVIFSWKIGDLEAAEYLWSNRKYKNSVMVIGRYVNVKVHTGGYSGFNRSMGTVEADDIDGHLSDPPAGAALTDIVNKMTVRGRAALAQQNRINLIRADVAEISEFHYRRDYDIGDIVTIDGNFGEIAPMRVVEFVEIQDENEERGHPTLESPNPEL